MDARTDYETKLSRMGLGWLFMIGGGLLFGLWALVPASLERSIQVRPEHLPQLAVSLYSLMAMSLVGYVLGRDLDVFRRIGQDAARAVTADWAFRGLLPFVAYMAVAGAVVSTGLTYRQVSLAEAALAAGLVCYGLMLARTRRDSPETAEAHS